MVMIIMAAGILIVIAVMILSWVTTSKAYSYKHTIDPIENNPHLKKLEETDDSYKKNN